MILLAKNEKKKKLAKVVQIRQVCMLMIIKMYMRIYRMYFITGRSNLEVLQQKKLDTTAKATTTIFFSKAITAVWGKAVNPFVPLAVYTTASYVFTATREIIKNSSLQEPSYFRF